MWKGPFEDGVTQSLLNQYMECPYCFYLYAILGLEEDEEEQNTNWRYGDSGHKGLELYIRDRDFPAACSAALKHLKKHHPQAPPSYQYSIPKLLRLFRLKEHYQGVWETEILIDKIVSINGQAVRCRGKKDAQCYDHPEYERVLGDHKFKGWIDGKQLGEEIREDFQVNFYLGLEDEPTEWFVYDLLKIPDAQKYGPAKTYQQSADKWIEKLFQGPIGSYGGKYPINQHKNEWIHQKAYYITMEDQEYYWDTVILPCIKRICEWYDYVTQVGFDHENPKYYNELFYRMPVRRFDGRNTDSYKCRYHGILTGQIQLEDLKPITSYYSELEEDDETV